MLVAVDTFFLSKSWRHFGTGVYLSNLLRHCLKVAGSEFKGMEFHGFEAPGDNWSGNGLASPLLRVHKARALERRRIWVFGGMALHAAAVHPDLVFLPNPLSSLPIPTAPILSTIHDTIPERLPAKLVEAGKLGLFMTRITAKLSRKIVTVSEWSKRDLVEVHGLDPDKIEVIYESYDKSLYNATPVDDAARRALLSRFGIRQPFILHHGMVQLRKNVHRLIQAWDHLHESHREFDSQLVLAGAWGLGWGEIRRLHESSPRRSQIIFTGMLSEEELATLIKSASLCVIPSLYEGFCLPLVEAMACGIPTVASSSSCIPEISGKILEYFDPYSVEEMIATIQRALEDSELRSRLKQQGLARVRHFSWERCARETLQIMALAG